MLILKARGCGVQGGGWSGLGWAGALLGCGVKGDIVRGHGGEQGGEGSDFVPQLPCLPPTGWGGKWLPLPFWHGLHFRSKEGGPAFPGIACISLPRALLLLLQQRPQGNLTF